MRISLACLLLVSMQATLHAAEGEDHKGEKLEPGTSLQDKIMRKWNWEGAVMSKVDLTGAVLEGANMNGADLEMAKIFGVNFNGADLRKANLDGTNWSSVAKKPTTAVKANLEGQDFKNGRQPTIFNQVDFSGANLKNVVFHPHVMYCDFRGADLCGANLSHILLDAIRTSKFTNAIIDRDTQFPQGFDVKAAGFKMKPPEEKK